MLYEFKGLETVKADIIGEKYKNVKIEIEKFYSGNLYWWQTPTFGSSTYYYFQNLKTKNVAFKLSQFSDLVKAGFEIDWPSATWGNPDADL